MGLEDYKENNFRELAPASEINILIPGNNDTLSDLFILYILSHAMMYFTLV